MQETIPRPIRLEISKTGVATLTLCRPDRKNAFTHDFSATLLAHCRALRADASVRVVLLAAEGRVFCPGADVVQMAGHMDDLPAYVKELIDMAHAAILALRDLSVPIVACVEGLAAGGGFSLLLSADFVIAAKSARMALAYAQLGTSPDAGLSFSLSQRIGAKRALQLFLNSDAINAEEASEMGLVDRVAEDGQAMEVAHEMAERLARLPPQAVISAKRLFLEGTREQLAARLDRERDAFVQCASTDDFRNRVLAFAKSRRG